MGQGNGLHQQVHGQEHAWLSGNPNFFSDRSQGLEPHLKDSSSGKEDQPTLSHLGFFTQQFHIQSHLL